MIKYSVIHVRRNRDVWSKVMLGQDPKSDAVVLCTVVLG